MTTSGSGGATFNRSVAYNTLSQASVFIFGFFNAVLSARVLGTEGKGQLAIFLVVVEISLVLMMLGLNTALHYYASRNDFRSQRTINTALVASLGSALAFFIVVQLAFLAGQGDRVLPMPFNSHFFRVLIGFHFLLCFFGILIGSILNSHKLFEQTSKMRIATITFLFVAYAGLFYLDKNGSQAIGVDSYYYVLAAGQVLYVALGALAYAKFVAPQELEKSWRPLPRAQLTKLFMFGLFPWVSGFLMRAVMRMDFWFVQEFAGLEALGLYSVASNIGDTLYLIPNTVGLVVLSFVADPATRVDSTHRAATAARIFFGAMAVGALLIAPFSSRLLAFAFGPEFAASGPLFNRLLWGIVPFSLANIISGYLLGTKQLKPVVKSALMGFALILILDFVLVPRMGAAGAAIGRSITFNAMAWYLVVQFRHISGLPYRRFLVPSGADVALLRSLLSRAFHR